MPATDSGMAGRDLPAMTSSMTQHVSSKETPMSFSTLAAVPSFSWMKPSRMCSDPMWSCWKARASS